MMRASIPKSHRKGLSSPRITSHEEIATTMRTRIAGVLIVAMGVFGLCVPQVRGAEARQPRKPNVLFIAVDDLNHWVGYLGRNPQTSTPNIDKLAVRGYGSRTATAQCRCATRRAAALMSGPRPATTGVYDNHHDWRRVIPEDLALTTTFRKAGYSVRGAGRSTTLTLHGPPSGTTIW